MVYMGFDKLENKLEGRKGVTSPGGLAAFIGRRKYGNKTFQAAAAGHRLLKGYKKGSGS